MDDSKGEGPVANTPLPPRAGSSTGRALGSNPRGSRFDPWPARVDEKTKDLHFDALTHGLSFEQYMDARRVADLTPGSITQNTRLLALAMKYPPDPFLLVCIATRRLVLEKMA